MSAWKFSITLKFIVLDQLDQPAQDNVLALIDPLPVLLDFPLIPIVNGSAFIPDGSAELASMAPLISHCIS